MIVLGLDLETTSFDEVETTRVSELGAVLYDLETETPLVILSYFIKGQGEISSQVTELTGITTEITEKYGYELEYVMKQLKYYMDMSDYIVAHNGKAFDKKILERMFLELNIEWPNKNWIDTMIDLKYPATCSYKNLTYLSGYYNIMSGGHRAVFDVISMLKIMSENIRRKHTDLNYIINCSTSPMKIVYAHVSYAEKDKAKNAGFLWNSIEKKWIKNIQEYILDEERKKWDFTYEIKDA